MVKFAIYALVGLLTLPMSTASAAQSRQKPSSPPPTQGGPSPLGISTLLCTADALVGGVSLSQIGDQIVLFGGQVIIEAASNITSPSSGLSAIDVTITHGTSSSNHTITFIDTVNPGTLNCGDTIVSVS
jgi:hypothetical protein